jgi:hypothetical protein
MNEKHNLTEQQLKEILTKAQQEADKFDNVRDFLAIIEMQLKRATGNMEDELKA